VERLGPDVPIHFTAFHPDCGLRDRPPTPQATLKAGTTHRARERRSLRLHGQRPRPRRWQRALPPLRRRRDRTGLLRARRLQAHRRRLLLRLRSPDSRPLRRPTRQVGTAPPPGPTLPRR
jgi:hypothetical protein